LREEADYEPETDDWSQKAKKATRLYQHIVDELRKRGKIPRP
jgi:uncharacterized protein YukE